jgi:DNA invertase Pin-like site-specific DNA recombinase
MASTDTPKRGASYARMSKDRAGAGVNVAQQEKENLELAARLGIDIVAKFSDNDLTAFKGSKRSRPRDDYNKLLAMLKNREVDAVIAWHTDRLHRDMTELEEYIGVCGEGRGGIPTYTVQGGDLDLSTASGRMVARILGAVARQEVEHMVERQRAGKQRNRDAGMRSGSNAPFGYRLDAREDGRQIPGVSKGMVIVENEAAGMRKAYADVLAGVSLYTIAASLTAAGLRTHRQARGQASKGDGTWKSTTVRHMLLRAANAALIEYPAVPPGRGKIVGYAAWDPIVDENTYYAARALLTDSARNISPGPKPKYLLTGVLICGICGCRYFAVRRGGGKNSARMQYNCASMTHAPSLPLAGRHLSREMSQLDAYVEKVIVERLRRPEVVAAINNPAVDIPALDARRSALNAELEEWARQEGITPRQLAIKSAPLLDDLKEVEEQLSRGLRGSGLEEFAEGTDPAKIWYGDPGEGRPPLPVERKRAVAALLLRVKLLPARHRKMPPGWRVGMPKGLDIGAIEILPPDAR